MMSGRRKIDSRGKKAAFHYPGTGVSCLGKRLSTASAGDELWIAAQLEERGRSGVVITRNRGKETFSSVIGTESAVDMAAIAADKRNGAMVVWNEFGSGVWKIRASLIPHGEKNAGSVETVAVSPGLMFQPAVAFSGSSWRAAWSERVDGRLRIRIASKREGGAWELYPSLLSRRGTDCFRPSISGGENKLIAAWDEYDRGRYRIIFGEFSGERGFSIRRTLGKAGERWMCPSVLASAGGTVFLCWVVLRETADSLGIAENFPFAMSAVHRSGGFRIIENPDGRADRRISADLREGLLASRSYLGYHGLRRRPHFCEAGAAGVYLLWESRKESERSNISGYLVGRRFESSCGWGAPEVIHGGRYGYFAAPFSSSKSIPVSYIAFEKEGLDRIDGEFVPVPRKKIYGIDRRNWKRWQNKRIPPIRKQVRNVSVKGREYSLFWADTHCHSNFSPDAEGEPDELIHFARDNAGLDIVAVTDNDYYPHKALTLAEWKVQNEFSRHFSRDGEFLVFPGWEFTYHRKDLSPDLNHRIVLYPHCNGKLYRRIDPDSSTDRKLLNRLESGPIVYPHHCTYKIINNEIEKNVEICSSWWPCFEKTDFTMEQLLSGKRLGFIASSDTHRAVPGKGGALTGVFAGELTLESVGEAFSKRRTIATEGFPVFIDFRVGGLFIGQEGKTGENPEIEAVVEAGEDIKYVEVIRDGKGIFRENVRARKFSCFFTDDGLEEGIHFYFLKLRLYGSSTFDAVESGNGAGPQKIRYPHNLARARGVFAWTSPVWIRKVHGR